MNENMEAILPKEVTKAYHFIKSLMETKIERRYKFIPNEEYKDINDIFLQTKIYWEEMLYRSHIASLLSLFKAARWMESMDNNYDNYYGFCSSLRGLIESCSDSFYSLRSLPLTIARDFEVIKQTINMSSKFSITHVELEKVLLHFIQATKLDTIEKKKWPKEYSAKQAREYIESIDDCDGALATLYSYLCGISHPAYEATQVFLFLHEGITIICSDSNEFERRLVETLIDESGYVIETLFRAFMGNIYCVMNLLNKFHVESIYTPIQSEAIEGHQSWIEIKELIDASIIKFSVALKTGNYD